jgi:hypothetical protein
LPGGWLELAWYTRAQPMERKIWRKIAPNIIQIYLQMVNIIQIYLQMVNGTTGVILCGILKSSL